MGPVDIARGRCNSTLQFFLLIVYLTVNDDLILFFPLSSGFFLHADVSVVNHINASPFNDTNVRINVHDVVETKAAPIVLPESGSVVLVNRCVAE